MGSLTDHLLTQTLQKAQVGPANYYNMGVIDDPLMTDLATLVADGEVSFSEAADRLMERHIAEGGDLDLLDATQERVDRRLSDLAFRLSEGIEDTSLGVLRPDVHPRVLLGLGIEDDRLSKEQINRLLAARRADSGDKIEGKTYASKRALPVNPADKEVRYSVPLGSLSFSPMPHKSVSVAWAFAQGAEQAQILNAHIEASREAMAYIAERIGQAREGRGGLGGSERGDVAWVEFTHHTARRVQVVSVQGETKIVTAAGESADPAIHTHFLVPNAVFTESGRVGSLDTKGLEGFIFEADALYHARLGTKLREAGFVVELEEKTGSARMSAVPDDVAILFSKRSAAGEVLARQAAETGGEHWDSLTAAQQTSRIEIATQSWEQLEKGGKDEKADFEGWRRQAKDTLGWEPTTFHLYGPPPPPLAVEDRQRLAYEIGLPWLAERLEHQAVIKHFDTRVAALRGLIQTGTDGLADVDAITRVMRTEGVVQYGEKTALQWGVEDGARYTSVTTTLHATTEAEFIRLAKDAAADRSSALPAHLLDRKVAESGLDFTGAHGRQQRNAIDTLGRGGRLGVAIGVAGAGKTAMLKPLVAAWREQGREVIGASLAWKQADDLVGAGIDRRSVKAYSVLIDGLKDGSIKVGPQTVVAVDEWGLIGTRQALELLRLRVQHGFTIVALGDDKQAQSIQAGAIIDLSRRALGAEQIPQILTTVRQQTERERQIVGLFRDGMAADALDMKRADGTAEMAYGGRDGVVRRVAALYAERLQATGQSPTISAPTNVDAHQISVAVRAGRRALGLLGEDLHTVKAIDSDGRNYTLALAAGDSVRLFRSTGAGFGGSRGSIGRNGSVLEVVAADQDCVTLRTGAGAVGTVSWDVLADKRTGRVLLAYGDATTIHTAQGSTANEHIFALPSGSGAINKGLGYVASSRHRHAAYLVTSEIAEREGVRSRRPLNDDQGISVDDKWANVARALSYQPLKDTATALAERVRAMRQGTVTAFQRTLLPAGIGPQGAPSLAPEVVAVRRVDISLRARMEQIMRHLHQAVGRTVTRRRRL
jgi:conjugative relaxase-like TrwC/TraI family protein